MTDPTPDTVADATATPTGENPAQDTDWKAEAERLKGEARKWETRSKENAKAAQRLSELEDAQKTELQRATERFETAERRIAEFESAQQVQAWKTEIATASGVPAEYLYGSTQDELKAHAEQLKPLFDKRGPVVPGAANTPSTAPSDERSFVRDLFGTT